MKLLCINHEQNSSLTPYFYNITAICTNLPKNMTTQEDEINQLISDSLNPSSNEDETNSIFEYPKQVQSPPKSLRVNEDWV